MDLRLKDKVAVVTGASRGIGMCCVQLFAEEGADVVAVARNEALLQHVAARVSGATGRRVLPVVCDMTDTEQVNAMVERTIAEFGRVDILVNNAGASPGGVLHSLSDADWFSSLNLKFMGYVRASRAVLPHMVRQGGGAVVNVVGNDGVKASYWEVTAGAANAADINLTKALAVQFGRHNIRVNACNPGPVMTDRFVDLVSAFARDMGVPYEQAVAEEARSIPLRRCAQPEEIADLVVFLASDRASHINGAIIDIDGAQQKALLDLLRDQVEAKG